MPLSKDKLKQLELLKSKTITGHLTKVMAGSIIVIIGTISFIAFNSGRVQLLKSINSEMVTVSDAIRGSISNFFTTATKDAMLLSCDEIVLQSIATDFENKNSLLGKIKTLQALNPAIKEIAVIKKNGKLVSTGDMSDVTSEEWFKKGLESDAAYWEDPTWDEKDKVYKVKVAAPIKSGKTASGVVCIELDFSSALSGNEGLKVGEKGFFSILMEEDNNQFRTVYVSDEDMNKEMAGKQLVEEKAGNDQVAIEGIEKALTNNVSDLHEGFTTLPVEIDGVVYDLAVENRGDGIYKVIASNYAEGREKRTALFYSCIVSGLIIGAISIFGLRVAIKKIGDALSQVNDAVSKLKEGDLTVELEGKILEMEHEAGQLGRNLNETVKSLNELVKNIGVVTADLSDASKNVSVSADESNSRIEEISITMNDIVEGINEQAGSAEHSAMTIGQLANKLNELEETTKAITTLTQEVRRENEYGSKSVQDLQYYTEQSNKSNKAVSVNVDELNKKTKDIESIVSAISAIAEQTNLLALNAAIEAARAGEHGAGFSVVAGEVKKLAEQSARYSEDIKFIVNGIQDDVNKTVSVMEESTKIIDAQNKAVSTVVDSFNVISKSTTSMDNAINDVYNFVEVLNVDKNAIVNGIEKISNVSQKSAAGSEEISASIQEQTSLTQNLANTVVKLNELAEGLSVEVSKFKTDK